MIAAVVSSRRIAFIKIQITSYNLFVIYMGSYHSIMLSGFTVIYTSVIDQFMDIVSEIIFPPGITM